VATGDLLDSKKEQDRLRRLAEYEILDTPHEAVFDDFAGFAADFCETPMSVLTFLDKEREWFKSTVGIPVTELPREQAFSAHAIKNGDLLVVPDVRLDSRFAGNPLVQGEPHIRSFAASPLFSADGSPLGAICVMDLLPHPLSMQQQRRLRTLTRDVTKLLELRREISVNRRYNEDQARKLENLGRQLNAESQEHKLAQRELTQQRQQLADVQRIAHLGSWEWNIATNAVTWSRELYRIYGLEPGEFEATYEAYLEFVHPDDREHADELVQNALRTGEGFASVYRIIRADGSLRHISSCGEVMGDVENKSRRMVGCCQDITNQCQTESNLATSLSLLNATLESTAEGILVVDCEGKVKRWNQKFLELWRLPSELKENAGHQEILSPLISQVKNSEAFLERLQTIYSDPETESFDIFEFTDGRTYERYSQPQRLGDRVVGRVWSIRDVTSRTLALKTLRQSEERYRSLIIASTQVVWTANAAGDIVEDTTSWREFTGQSFDEILGRGWLKMVHPKDRSRVNDTWSHAVSTRSIYQSECRIRQRGGEWRDVTVRGVPIFDTDGTVREWVGFCLDVTDQKRAEQTILQQRDFSQALINSLPGIFYVLDEHGLNLRWNKNLETVSEYSSSEIARMNAIDFVPPEEKGIIAERVRKVFVTGHATVEITFLSKTGKRTPFYCTGSLVNVGGKPHLVGMGIDISKLRRAQEEVLHLNKVLEQRVAERTKQLKASNLELESFSYTTSHDLRAPIRAMVGFAHAVHEDYGTQIDQEGRHYLERIMKSGDRMLQLIDDLLEYSRIGRAALHIHQISLAQLFSQLEEDLSLQLKAIGGELRVSADMPSVTADQTLLRQIFSNLLQNAIAYRRKEVPLRISVDWTQLNQNIIINVTDNGIGIEPEYFEKIFEIFHSLNRDEETGGTGIGLANVKRAAEVLGGSVGVSSKIGQGSTFSVTLPLGR
jgi:PAS domain S-box-containing protein